MSAHCQRSPSGVTAFELFYVCAAIMFLVLAISDLALILRAGSEAETLAKNLAQAAAKDSSESEAKQTLSRLLRTNKQDGFFIKDDVSARMVSYVNTKPVVPDLSKESLPERMVTVEVTLSAWVPATFLFHMPFRPEFNSFVVPGSQPDTIKLTSSVSQPVVDLTRNPGTPKVINQPAYDAGNARTGH